MKLGLKTAIIFVLGTLIIGVLGIQSYLKIQQLTEASRWVVHTQEVQKGLERVLLRLVDAETGGRGFVLTGQDAFLEPYNTAIKEIPKDIDSVASLTKDNPQQQASIRQLSRLSRDKLDVVRNFINARRMGGLKAALPIILRDNGRLIMNRIRVLIDQMTSREEQLLDTRNRNVNKLAQQGFGMLALWMLMSILILGVAAVVLTSTVRIADRDQRLQRDSRKGLRIVQRYVFVVPIVGLSIALRWWLLQSFGPMPLYLTFYPSVLLVAMVSGGGPGILATLLSALAADYWFIEPIGQFNILGTNDAVSMGIFAGTGVFLSVLVEYYHQLQKKSIEAIRQANMYNRSLIEASLDPLVTISADGKITDANEAAVKVRGISKEKLIGTEFAAYFTEPEKARQVYHEVFAKGFVTDYPLTIRNENGWLTDVLYNASLYRDAHGNVLGIFAAARDVTLLRHAEAELKAHRDNLEVLVKERTSELETVNRQLAQSNENLEQFAYVASHDLQEPLRVMSSYSQLLKKRYKGKLGSDADDFIGFVVDAASRMQKLIVDLLAYSRSGKHDHELVKLDSNETVDKVIRDMSSIIENSEGEVTHDQLPVLMAHETCFIQLFQNLISNALKYRRDEPPKVHISASRNNGAWFFSVADNGIGIEPQYYERIFQIFERLHSKHEYSGTGIGLAICKKIVLNYGGKIWVESQVGKGSTFYFTIPS